MEVIFGVYGERFISHVPEPDIIKVPLA
jgi:hypothetical protein